MEPIYIMDEDSEAPIAALPVLMVIGIAIVALAITAAFLGWAIADHFGWALLLPGLVDYQPRERRLFTPPRTLMERFDACKWSALGYAGLAFAVLFVSGVLS